LAGKLVKGVGTAVGIGKRVEQPPVAMAAATTEKSTMVKYAWVAGGLGFVALVVYLLTGRRRR
jgi:hypothetical protein